MKRNEQTDKGFRQLEATSLIMPSPQVWEGIEDSLDGKKSRKGFWIWSLSLLALCGVAGLGYLFDSQYINNKSSLATQSSSVRSVISTSHSAMHEQNTSNSTNGLIMAEEQQLSSNVIEPKDNPSVENHTVILQNNKPKHTAPVLHTPTISNHDLLDEASLENTLTVSDENLPPLETEVSDYTAVVDRLEPEDEVDETILDDPCPSMNQKVKKHFFLELGGLAGSHLKQFSTSNESVSQLREDTESEWYTWGGFVGAGLYLKPNLYFSVNLDMLQQKDLFEYSREGISRMIVEYDPMTGEELSSHTVNGSWSSQGEIKRTTLDGSFNVGYMFNNGVASRNAWQLGIEPGVLYNISLISKGKVMVDQEEISRLENENLYRESLGLGYQMQLIIAKHLKNSLQLNIKPFYRGYVGEWSTSSDDLNISTFGVKVGLRKTF